ncbi:MAG: sigma-54-dependent Fis family transcriptional regulator, partial [Betaproteobacteria bacterium]|nr:sigma-54-dependent Fis family transcriptional regulator [Betaproteobacteria bacterium]
TDARNRQLNPFKRFRLYALDKLSILFGPKRPWIKFWAVVCSISLAVLLFGQMPYRIEASAQLTTDSVRVITPQMDGRLQEADGGSLLLDDIDSLPPAAQLGLIRVLQENLLVRVGGSREDPVRVRLLAATRRNLADEVAAGRFRADLYARLKVLALRLPPLRDRLADLPLLAHRCLLELEARYGLGPRQLGSELQAALARLPWPGNVQELRALLEAMYLQSEGEVLGVADLPESYADPQALASAADGAASDSISELERAAIEAAIARHSNNLSAVARRLGISRSTLYRKMKRYGLAVD